MEQKNFQYPTFTAGEVLSKEILDNLVEYTDEQQRLSRSKLIGFGIVHGLKFSYDLANKQFEITPGVAITANGNIICIDSAKTYKWMIKKENYYILLEKHEENAIPIEYNSSMLLELKYDKVVESAFNCTQTSCDVIHNNTTIHYTPILKEKTNESIFSAFENKTCEYLRLQRHFNILKVLITNYFHNSTREIFHNNCQEVKRAMGKIIEELKPNTILGFILKPKQLNSLSNLINNGILRLDKLIKYSGPKMTSTEIPLYFLSFLEDIECAYNEMMDSYYEILERRNYSISRMLNVPNDIIVLGDVNNPINDIYRNNFIKAFDNFLKKDNLTLYNHINRIGVIISQFSATSYRWNNLPISLVAFNKNKKLKYSPLPFYYHAKDNQTELAWTLQQNSKNIIEFTKANNASNDDYHAHVNDANYLIGGYYNKDKDSLIKGLKEIVESHELPVIIKDVNLISVRSTIDLNRYLDTLDLFSKSFFKAMNGYLNDFKNFVSILERSENFEKYLAGYKELRNNLDTFYKFEKICSKDISYYRSNPKGLICYPNKPNKLSNYIKISKKIIDNLTNPNKVNDSTILKKADIKDRLEKLKIKKDNSSIAVLYPSLYAIYSHCNDIKDCISGKITSTEKIQMLLQLINSLSFEEINKGIDTITDIEKSDKKRILKVINNCIKFITECYNENLTISNYKYCSFRNIIYVVHYNNKVIACCSVK